MGKLIVIDGLDGSGKSTQAKILCNNLKMRGYECKKISAIDHNENSSALAEMYLSGKFGDNINDVNSYAASVFFAVDRYASYNLKWKQYYNSNYFIIADRYTTSNIIYQMSKLPKDDWNNFLIWLYDLEYNKFKLPKPDLVIYFDMDILISSKLLIKRYGSEQNKDIHEKNLNYLKICKEAALYATNKLSWERVMCFENAEPYTIENIEKKILDVVFKKFKPMS